MGEGLLGMARSLAVKDREAVVAGGFDQVLVASQETPPSRACRTGGFREEGGPERTRPNDGDPSFHCRCSAPALGKGPPWMGYGGTQG